MPLHLRLARCREHSFGIFLSRNHKFNLNFKCFQMGGEGTVTSKLNLNFFLLLLIKNLLFSSLWLRYYEMWFLRLAKSRRKLFWTQFLFGTEIKSTFKNVLPNTWILDLSVKWRSQQPISVLSPRQN